METKIRYNRPPTYEARQKTDSQGTPCRGVFTIVEYRDGEEVGWFTLSNRGDRMQNLRKRGIPEDEARKLFYQMDD